MLVLEAGTTIKASVQFRDSDGQLIDVDSPTLTIYDAEKTVISTDTDNVIRQSLGTYSCLYETPLENDRTLYYVEFSGTVGGYAVVVRTPFITRFDI